MRCDNKYYEKSLKDYDKAISMDPQNPGGYYDRGLAKLDALMLHEAIADFDKCIVLNPKTAGAFNNRGICYYELKEYDKALENYNIEITLRPNDGYAYNNRGVVKIKMGGEGCEDIRKALALGDKESEYTLEKYCTK